MRLAMASEARRISGLRALAAMKAQRHGRRAERQGLAQPHLVGQQQAHLVVVVIVA